MPAFKKELGERRGGQRRKELGNCRFVESLLLNPDSLKKYEMNQI